MRRRLFAVTAALFVLGILGVAAFLLRGPAIRARLDAEVFKLTYQFLLLVVVGGVVSLIYQAMARAREQRERDRAIQRDVHSSVVAAYNEAKKVRRLLRARALRSGSQARDFMVLGGEYDKQLQRLVDAQLALERAIHTIAADSELFVAEPALIERLERMEDYLSAIIKEYEDSYRTFGSDAETKPLSGFSTLNDFVLPYDKSKGFGPKFKTPFSDALKMLTSVIRS